MPRRTKDIAKRPIGHLGDDISDTAHNLYGLPNLAQSQFGVQYLAAPHESDSDEDEDRRDRTTDEPLPLDQIFS